MSQEQIKRNPDGTVDLSRFSQFEKELMWDKVCQGILVQQKVESRLNSRGIFIEKGPDGNYRAVRRDHARRKHS